jgi:hypothetical protein
LNFTFAIVPLQMLIFILYFIFSKLNLKHKHS